jgi:hypothetical protein
MGYSKEFIEWTNSDLEYTFEVKKVSAGMLPGDSNNVSCEGTGYTGMFKDFDGNLMLKMNSDNQDGFIMEKYVDVKGRFLK